MGGVLERWGGYLEEGGFVMPYLALAAAVLWFALGYRWLTLRRGSRRGLRWIIENVGGPCVEPRRGIICEAAHEAVRVVASRPRDLRAALADALGTVEVQLGRFAVLARVIVLVAPLTGLLGTVAGMIKTFEALGDMTLFSQSGGIAGGISQALISTQMGLAVAIPGLVLGRVLSRRQEALADELERLKDLVCSGHCALPAAGGER